MTTPHEQDPLRVLAGGRAEVSRMTTRELLEHLAARTQTITDTLLDHDEGLGAIAADVSIARQDATAAKVESRDTRKEVRELREQLGLKTPSKPPPAMPTKPDGPRRRLESMIEIADEDPTAVREYKGELAAVVQAYRDRMAVRVFVWTVLKWTGAVGGAATVLGGAAITLWALFKFALAHVPR